MSEGRHVTLGWFVVSLPASLDGTECPDCGFDTVVLFPVTLLSESGVTPWGHAARCTRCWMEANE
ncbi:hypothetical protein [Nocardioides alkalitolerans]|uniref:hypothetical protein n=1 Tax=Nocardioides alkalitolerans TaxID=281714 RepID=UPI00041863C5|nr:hypothetical protein [Nocardioides alkalitolerans]